jgi:hypothetical protein
MNLTNTPRGKPLRGARALEAAAMSAPEHDGRHADRHAVANTAVAVTTTTILEATSGK